MAAQLLASHRWLLWSRNLAPEFTLPKLGKIALNEGRFLSLGVLWEKGSGVSVQTCPALCSTRLPGSGCCLPCAGAGHSQG